MVVKEGDPLLNFDQVGYGVKCNIVALIPERTDKLLQRSFCHLKGT